VAVWLDSEPQVEAKWLSSAAPEQIEGTVDGRTFYFRERHGLWRIELDLDLNSTYSPGTVIAKGIKSDLGEGKLSHLQFVVRVIRSYLGQSGCPHPGARAYCPVCGTKMESASPDGVSSNPSRVAILTGMTTDSQEMPNFGGGFVNTR